MSVDEFLAVLANENVIAVNQDTFVKQGTNVTAYGHLASGGAQVWAKPLSGGAAALLLLNAAWQPNATLNIHANFAQAGLANATCHVHDLWTGNDLGVHFGSLALDVAYHDAALLKLVSVDGGRTAAPPPRNAHSTTSTTKSFLA